MNQGLEVVRIEKRDQDEDVDLDQRAMKVHLEADLEILLEAAEVLVLKAGQKLQKNIAEVLVLKADQKLPKNTVEVPVLKVDHIVEAIEIIKNPTEIDQRKHLQNNEN